jgi:putative DNA primase/helicase
VVAARLVVAQETQKGRRWDESKIKNLTGGDTLSARFMRGDLFDFKPSHKLLIAGNYKPTLRSVDEAIRRRLLLVPFAVQIPEANRDPELANKLKVEWPAILRWMVDGCMEWQRYGLKVPASVRAATDDYLADQDTLSQWWNDCIDLNVNAFTHSRALFKSWQAWCKAGNAREGTEKGFVESLKQRGCEQGRDRMGKGFRGIALKAADDPPLPY